MSSVPDILRRIVDQRRQAMAQHAAKSPRSVALPHSDDGPPVDRGRRFVDSLRRSDGPAIIAEVKLGSPRLGDLRDRVDPLAQAAVYAEGGAAALSVVTEPDFFFGSYELLTTCASASGLPALSKDFIVDAAQIEWADRAGAGACLLIAALYSERELRMWADAIESTGMVAMVECHSSDDIAKLGDREWPVVGINNRNLRTFEVDLEHSSRLLDHLPVESVKVAESGLSERAQVGQLYRAGFDAFLVGESLLLDPDPGAHLRRLMGESAQ